MSKSGAPTFRRSGPAWSRDDSDAAFERIGEAIAGWIPALVVLYVFVIWPLVFVGPPTTLAIETMGWSLGVSAVEGPEEGPEALKVIAYPLLFALAAACAIASASYRRVPWLAPSLLPLFAFIALATLSTTWSVEPKLSFMRAGLLAMTSLTLLLSVYTARGYEPIMRRVFWVLVITAVANAVAIVVKPPTSLGHGGLYAQKNIFGAASAIILAFGLYGLTRGGLPTRLASLFMIAVTPVFLVLSQSKTSIGLALIGPILACALMFAARRLLLSPAVVFPLGVVCLTFVFLLGRAAGAWDLYAVNEAIFGNATLTGRTEIWAFAMGLIENHTLTGLGYEAVFGTGPGGIAAREGPGFVRVMPTSHNGYIDIWVQTGIMGFACVVALIVVALYVAGRLLAIKPAYGWLLLAMTSFAALHNCLESDLLISSNPISMTLLLLLFVGLRILDEAPASRHRAARHLT